MTPNPVRPESDGEDPQEVASIRERRDFSQRALDVVRKATERHEDEEPDE